MYAGTLIEELMTTVERAEERAVTRHAEQQELEHWYAAAHRAASYDLALAGVA